MKHYLLSLLLFLLCWRAYAQEIVQSPLVEKYATSYMNLARSQAAIFNGDEQKKYPRTPNDPYLKSQEYTMGRLSYNGVLYPDVRLRLDLCRDELVALSPNYQDIVLSSEKIDFAELHNYRILYLSPGQLPDCPFSGFYILLYSGSCMVMEKRSFSLELREGQSTFIPSVKYYIYKDDTYLRVRNKRSLLKALGDYRRELAQYIRHSNLRFRSDAEKMIVEVMKEYERLHEQ